MLGCSDTGEKKRVKEKQTEKRQRKAERKQNEFEMCFKKIAKFSTLRTSF